MPKSNFITLGSYIFNKHDISYFKSIKENNTFKLELCLKSEEKIIFNCGDDTTLNILVSNLEDELNTIDVNPYRLDLMDYKYLDNLYPKSIPGINEHGYNINRNSTRCLSYEKPVFRRW